MVGCRSTTTSVRERCVTKRSGEKTGCSWAVRRPDRGRPSCSRSSPARSATASNRGPICASYCSACTTTIHISTTCSPTDGRPITPKPSSPIGWKNPAAKRPHGARAVVTPAQRAQPLDQRRDTMPRPGAYSNRSFSAQQRPVIPLPPPTAASFGPALNSQRITGTHNRFVKRSAPNHFKSQQKGLAWVQGQQ